MDKNFNRAMECAKMARDILAEKRICWQDDYKVDELNKAIENLSVKSDCFTREYLLIKSLQNSLLDTMSLVEDEKHRKNMYWEDRQGVFDYSGLAINAFGDYLD